MEMLINFPGGLKVNATFGSHTVYTDQPGANGSTGSAPTPFATFLASVGTCAGVYVLGFCKQRGISTEGIQIIQRMESNPFTGMIDRINLEIQVPAEFPEKYKEALVRVAGQCAVKKLFENPPDFNIYTNEMELVTAQEG